MALTNSPSTQTMLRLESHKSYSFAVHVTEPNGGNVDLTGCTISMVAKTAADVRAGTDDDANLIANAVATIDNPTSGEARFNLQASDLALGEGEFPFSIGLLTSENYSATLVHGSLIMLAPTSLAAIDSTYVTAEPVQTIDVTLRDMQVISVSVGTPPPAGYGFLSDQQAEYLDQLVAKVLQAPAFGTAAFANVVDFAIAAAAVPAGGFQNRVLGKLSNDDYDIGWLNLPTSTGDGGGWFNLVEDPNSPGMWVLVEDADGALDAVGITSGFVPVAQGNDLWEWANPYAAIDLDAISDTVDHVVMTDDERTKLASIETGAEVNVQADWAAADGSDSEILNKPTLGSAAAADTGDFAAAAHSHDVSEISDMIVSETEPDPATYLVWIKKPAG